MLVYWTKDRNIIGHLEIDQIKAGFSTVSHSLVMYRFSRIMSNTVSK